MLGDIWNGGFVVDLMVYHLCCSLEVIMCSSGVVESALAVLSTPADTNNARLSRKNCVCPHKGRPNDIMTASGHFLSGHKLSVFCWR